MTHELKTWPQFFWDVWLCHKTFEVRRNDRNFKVSDTLRLLEWDPNTEQYTGAEMTAYVGYILQGGAFGIEHGFCVLGLQHVFRVKRAEGSGTE